MSTKDSIESKCHQLKELLLKKNDAYGDAALQPLGVFSSCNAVAGIKLRLDDKLKRIANAGLVEDTEDTLIDIAGYIILLMIAKDNESNNIRERIRKEKSSSHNPKNGSTSHTGGEISLDYKEES